MIKGIAILIILVIFGMSSAVACDNIHENKHKCIEKHQFRHHEVCNNKPVYVPPVIQPCPQPQPQTIIVTQTVTVPVTQTVIVKEKSVSTQIVEKDPVNTPVVEQPVTNVVKEQSSQPVSQPENNSVAKNETIPMKKTGTPLELPLIAGLLVVAGSMYAKIRMG